MDLSELEMVVSRAIYTVHAFERALHDAGPWTMAWGPYTQPARRTIHPDGVSFSAEFPESCWITRPDTNITLYCRDEVNAIRAIEYPGDTAFAVVWNLSVTTPDRTAA